MDKIDIILYINLESRKDRNERIICQLNIFKKYDTNIKRINACATPYDGGVGCTLSHIFALKYALMEECNENILILEDDFEFTRGSDELHTILNKLFERDYAWDCVLLSYGTNKSQPKDDLLSLVSMAEMTSGYLIRRHAVQSLIDTYQNSLKPLITTRNHFKYATDRSWENSMKSGRWFIFNERLGIQCAGYSDIAKKNKNETATQHLERNPKIYVIHNGDSSILILRDILDRDYKVYREAPDDSEYNEDYKFVIIVGEKYSASDFPNSYVIEDPDLYPTLTFTELLSQSGYKKGGLI